MRSSWAALARILLLNLLRQVLSPIQPTASSHISLVVKSPDKLLQTHSLPIFPRGLGMSHKPFSPFAHRDKAPKNCAPFVSETEIETPKNLSSIQIKRLIRTVGRSFAGNIEKGMIFLETRRMMRQLGAASTQEDDAKSDVECQSTLHNSRCSTLQLLFRGRSTLA